MTNDSGDDERDDYVVEYQLGELNDPPKRKRFTRRQALGALGATGVVGLGALAGREIFFDPVSSNKPHRRTQPHHEDGATGDSAATTETPATEPPPPQAGKWSDPATWGGTVPGEGDVAVIEHPVMLDIDTQVAGVQIKPGGELIYEPAIGHTLTSSGNVVVEGKLTMRPDSHAIQHLLAFAGIDESNYAGDHTMTPVETDIGLWTMDAGVLDLFGSPKTAWTHLAGEAGSGAATITVDDAAGWQVNDEIVVTPTEPTTSTDDGVWEHHDRRVITAISGNSVTLDQPLKHPHPAVTIRPGVTHRAEVLNLGRNVRVEGTEDGRAHLIILHGTVPQKLGWFALRHMGPRQGDTGVLGRYALHFHMCNDGVRGSTVDGGVVADSGNHAFVVHLTNGVTLTDCIAHDNINDAFWWDLSPITATPDAVPSDDVVYDRCVASYVQLGDNVHAVAGFQITAGARNVARNCVAVGIDGAAVSSAGFIWQKHSSSRESWIFEDNLVHNSKYGGIYYWQNNSGKTIVDRFTVYHSGIGIFAGSYINAVSYRDCNVYACPQSGLMISAVAMTDDEIGQSTSYEGNYVDQAGLTDYALEVMNPSVQNYRMPTAISGCTFKGGNVAQVGIEGGDGLHPQMYEFRDCEYDGNAFWLTDEVRGDSEIRVFDGTNGSILLRAKSAGGNVRSEWNASIAPA